MYCQNCGANVSESAGSCPDCGAQLPGQAPSTAGQGAQQGSETSSKRQSAQGQGTTERRSQQAQAGGGGQSGRRGQATTGQGQGRNRGGQRSQQSGRQSQRQGSHQQQESRQGQRQQGQGQRTRSQGQQGAQYQPETGSLTDGISVFYSGVRGLSAVIQGVTLVFAVFAFQFYQTVQNSNADIGMAAENVLNLMTFGAVQTQQSLEAAVVPIVKSVTWLFMNAQGVPITGTSAVGQGGNTNLITQLSQTTPQLTTPLFYQALVVLVLVWGGFKLARNAESESLGQGGVAGAALALGYVPLLALVAFLGSVSIGGPTMTVATVGPDPATAATMAAGYSLVCGAVGGLAGGALGS